MGMRSIWILLVFAFWSGEIFGQSFFQVSIPSGTQHFIGNSVTVRPDPQAGLHSSCGTGPYTINAAKSGYTFIFSRPVNRIRAQLTNLNIGERIGFYINGSFFYVTPGHLSPYGGTCILGLSQAINGYVTEINSGASTAAMVDIEPGYKIDSISIVHEEFDAQGTHFSFFFEGDPQVLITEPFNDSLMCRTDSVSIPYHVNLHFNNGNEFIAELSDKDGDFSNPRIIGSIVDVGTNRIPAYLPADIPIGEGYKIRVRATDPPRLSSETDIDISIDRYPPIQLHSNSPVCIDHPIKLVAQVDSGVRVSWKGPSDFSSALRSPEIEKAAVLHEGTYYLQAERNGCMTMDSLTIDTKPTPVIGTVYNSSPVCEGGEVKLGADQVTEGASYSWTGPQGFKSQLPSPPISSVAPRHAGEYGLQVTKQGCSSLMKTTKVSIDAMPVIHHLENTSPFDDPAYAGDRVILRVEGSEGAQYAWTGPNEFSSTDRELVFDPITSANEGIYKVLARIGVCEVGDSTRIVVRNRKRFAQYPNPASTSFEFFTFVEKPQSISYRLTDGQGRVVYTNHQEATQGSIRAVVPTSGLAEGIYYFEIIVDEEQIRLKIQVAH